MPRKRTATPVPFGMSTKQMKRKKPINQEYLKPIEPLTENQERFFHDYGMDQNIFAYGAAGTGKTFIALYQRFLVGESIYHATNNFLHQGFRLG